MVNVDRIKALAKLRGFKLGYLCDLLGEDQNYFNKVKLGVRRMDDNRIAFLAEKLGTTFAYLTDVSNDPLPPTKERHPVFQYTRYEERRIARHLTANYVEDQIGVPHGYMDSYYELSEGEVYKLAILLNTTYEYLMGMTDDPRIPTDDRTGVKIKLFGEVAAGIPIKQIDNFDPDDESSWEEINRSTAKNGTYFALRIKGDSMATRIQNGDRVIVRYQETVESGQTAVVAINGDTATCKKVIWDEQGGMILMSNNPAYAPRYFTAEQIQKLPVRILGRVVEIRGEP